jgi:hypothetical protein
MKNLWEQITGKKVAWDTTKIEDAQRTCAFYCTANDINFFCNHDFEIGKNPDGTPATKKCTDTEKIRGYNLQECKDAGINQASCS